MTRAIWGWLAVAITASSTAFAQPDPQPQPEPAPDPQPQLEGAPAPPPTGPTLDVDPDAWLEAMGLESTDALFAKLEQAAPVMKGVVKGAIRRGRRSISIGPTAGVYGSSIPSPGETDLAVTFGIGAELFKIPVLPTWNNLKELVKERAKAKLKKAVVDALKGRQPDPNEVTRLAQEAWDEAVREVLGMENIRAKRIEKPRLTIGVEGNYLFRSETWMTRLRVGAGLWKVTLAASVTAGFTDPKTSIFVGPEVVLHVLMSKGPRASVVDVFVRGDFEVRNRDLGNTDTFTLGLRYLLDII
jgi:hypothetical protein